MSSPTPPIEPFKILSFDGGGIRGLSSLLILEKIMEHIKEHENLSEIPKPCDKFDLIGGTGTGGIIAIMLGRLRMSVDQCIQAYKKLAEAAFTPKRPKFIPISPSDAFSASNLECAIKQTIREHCTESQCAEQRKIGRVTIHTCPHEDLPFRDGASTKTAILAITKSNAKALPTLFTTHDTSTRFAGCKVWEVARATSAAATLFKPIKIGRDEIEFIDASFGYNNPCENLIVEAEKRFPGREMIILSIGAGVGDVVRIGNTKDSIMAALTEIAITSNSTAARLENRYMDTGRYFRFNVKSGLDSITVSDWKHSSEVLSHTMNYIRENKSSLLDFVKVMTMDSVRRPRAQGGFPQVSARSRELDGRPSVHYIPFHENLFFVGREDTLSKLRDKLFNRTGFREVALVGLGGMGKTQVALKLAHWVKRSKPDYSVFWLSMADMAIFHNSCKKLAEKLEIKDTDQSDPKMLVKHYLESEQSGKWLLILDNLDDIEFFNATEARDRITHFLPYNDVGRILLTTRFDQVAWSAVQDRADIIKLEEMSSEELTDILKPCMEGLDYESQLHDKALVSDFLEELCYLPLAVSQASDYMLIHDVSISDYLGLLRTAESTKLRLLNKTHIDEAHYHHSQGAVTTTWIITFQQIHKASESAAALLEAISHMSPKSIPQSSFPKFEEPEEIIEAIGILLGYGFLRRQKTPGLFDMHSLVHSITRLWYKKSLETDFF